MSTPENGSSMPLAVPLTLSGSSPAPAEAGGEAGSAPGRGARAAGLPPTSPAPPRNRRSVDGAPGARRSMDGGQRRSVDGGQRRGRHAVEVPEGAERHEGLVVSRQEKFGFIKGSTHEGRYFFHVNDSDGAAAYGCTVSFIIARDLTTGKDVAYGVRTLAPPVGHVGGTLTPGHGSTGPASRSSTPDRASAAAASAFFGAGPGEGEAAAADAVMADDASPAPGAGMQQRTPPQGQPRRSPHPGQPGPGGFIPGPADFQQGGPGNLQHRPQGQFGRPDGGYEHFGAHRQPSPATQRDWRLPAREAAFAAAHGALAEGGEQLGSRRSSAGALAGPSPAPSVASSAPTSTFFAGGEPAAAAAPAVLARYRGTVAQVARAGRQHQQDDGLLLYIDENGSQQQARYGNWRLAEGVHRLEPGDVVEFGVEAYPGAAPGHRKAAAEVRFLSKGIVHSPSLEALAVAAEAGGDPLSGRQLGRVALLKKEFGFIRQMERPGDMFFHFSQLDGWSAEDVKVGDDVEYTIRRDRNDPNKLSAVAIRCAPPGAVVFESVGADLLRGVVLERPTMGKQYGATSGLLEYTIDSPADGSGDSICDGSLPDMPGMPGLPAPPPGLNKGRLPFTQQDVQQGSGSLRPGDHVTFRLATNLQAAKAAALASVPGAAQYAGKRAVEVSMVRYAAIVAQVNRKRQFGFLLYGEDQLVTGSGDGGSGSSQPATESGEAPAAAAEPGAEGGALAAPATPAPAGAHEGGPGTEPAAEGGAAVEPAAEGGAAAGEAGATAAPAPKRSRIFFHFKEVAGQCMLKPGDEVVFVLHSNLKTGELNAQRVRRTKEGPELPPEPEKPKKVAEPPVPAVNPNRTKYSGNLQVGKYKQPKIAKGPDGTPGFEFPRPHAVMPPLPGLEKKPEPEPEPEPEAGEGAAEGGEPMEVDGLAAAQAAAAAALAALPPGGAPADAHPGGVPHPHPVHLMHHGPHPPLPTAAKAVPVDAASVASPQRGVSPAGRLATPAGGAAADTTAPGWQGGTPFSALAAMTLSDAVTVERGQPAEEEEHLLIAHLSAEAPVFVPKILNSGSLGGAPQQPQQHQQTEQGGQAPPAGDTGSGSA